MSADEKMPGDAGEHPEHVERLLNRLIDEEDRGQDFEQFESLAAAEPTLWRTLALRQRQHARLASAVHDATSHCEGVPLPPPSPRGAALWISRFSPAIAWTGWAAVILLGQFWYLSGRSDDRRPAAGGPGAQPAARLSPEEHLAEYRQAPYVVDEMQPMLLDVEELSDGRLAVLYLRRLQEVIFLNPSTDLPLNEEGEITLDPEVLRSRSADPIPARRAEKGSGAISTEPTSTGKSD